MKDSQARFEAILSVCGSKPQFAIEQFLKGSDKGKAAEAYASLLEKELRATNGVGSGVEPVSFRSADQRSGAASDDFEAQWDADADNCRKASGCSSKASYVGYMKWKAKQSAKR